MDSSVDKSMRLVYDVHKINMYDSKRIDDISEMFDMMNDFCHNIALHCIRVSNYSTIIGKRLSLSAKDIKLLWYASLFHDIGKVKLSREILNKPTKLTGEEYGIVRKHSCKGYEIIRKHINMTEVATIILYHHERFDSSGYPARIGGYEIPILSRIISVADAFDAMTSERPYSMALSLDSALAELENGKWTQFDGHIVTCFIDLIEDSWLKPKEQNTALGLY